MQITQSVEVNSNDENQMAYFPMRPPCFMLSKRMKKDHRDKCDISDSVKKMTDLMSLFKVFKLAMQID